MTMCIKHIWINVILLTVIAYLDSHIHKFKNAATDQSAFIKNLLLHSINE